MMDCLSFFIPRSLRYALSFEKLQPRVFTGDIEIILSRLKNFNNYSAEFVEHNSNYNISIEKINFWTVNLFKTYLSITLEPSGSNWIFSGKIIYKLYAKLLIIIYILSGVIIGIQTGNILIAIAVTIFAIHLISLLLKLIKYLVNENPTYILNQLDLDPIPSK
jgi:cytochrome b subunit of formate dehydrogenase